MPYCLCLLPSTSNPLIFIQMKKTGTRLIAGLVVAVMVLPAFAQTYRSASTNGAPMAGFGEAVAVHDGVVYTSEARENDGSGVIYMYTQSSDGQWDAAGEIKPSNGESGDRFGTSMAIDGTHMVVGAPRAGDSGAAYVYMHDGTAWQEVGSVMAEDAGARDGFGSVVNISGNHIFVGTPMQKGRAGAVYVFAKEGNDLMQVGKIQGSDTKAGDRFGSAITTDGDRMFVGAPRKNSGRGVVYVFEKGDDGWAESSIIALEELDPNTRMGSSLSANGDILFVGAPMRESAQGAVYMFEHNEETGAWGFESSLKPFDPASQIRFGNAVAFEGDHVWVGAPGADSRRGAVYLFTWDVAKGGWTGVSKLSADERNGGDGFGGTVAASGNVAVVGATGADQNLGKAIIFTNDGMGGAWSEQATVFSEVEGLAAVTGEMSRCEEGKSAHFDCKGMDLISFLPIEAIGGGRGIRLNDIWGWEDPETRKEYALVGRIDGSSFVDISDPANPIYLGNLERTEGSPMSTWRDIKVYNNYAFIVADGAGQHGMQVFDLTRLRGLDGSEPQEFEADAHYDQIASSHNIVINEDTGFGYAVGSSGGGETCGGGLHIIDLRDPLSPSFAGCFSDAETGRAGTGYTHDAQCVTYDGPDTEHRGKEICFSSNETALSIGDVSDKSTTLALSNASYPSVAYSHQGWLTDDHRYFYMNDELDEVQGLVEGTRTLIWNVEDLDDPKLVREYVHSNPASDHNLYIKDNFMYQSNYASGLRVFDISDRANPVEVAFYDTNPVGDDSAGFTGTWSNYPYFDSGVIIVSSIGEGLFIVKKQDVDL